jgi:hypothetical protein
MAQDLVVQTRRPTDMAMRKGPAAAAILLLSISGASACDDYPEEMALALARRDALLAQSATAQPRSAVQVLTDAAGRSAVPDTAVAEPAAPQPQTIANLAGALRR